MDVGYDVDVPDVDYGDGDSPDSGARPVQATPGSKGVYVCCIAHRVQPTSVL